MAQAQLGWFSFLVVGVRMALLLGLVMFSGQLSWGFSCLLVLYLFLKPTGFEGIEKTVQCSTVISSR